MTISSVWPLPVTVANKSLEEFPTKHVIILVVTVTGKVITPLKLRCGKPSLAQISRPEGLVYSINGSELQITSLVPKIKEIFAHKTSPQQENPLDLSKYDHTMNIYKPFEISINWRRGEGLVKQLAFCLKNGALSARLQLRWNFRAQYER